MSKKMSYNVEYDTKLRGSFASIYSVANGVPDTTKGKKSNYLATSWFYCPTKI